MRQDRDSIDLGEDEIARELKLALEDFLHRSESADVADSTVRLDLGVSPLELVAPRSFFADIWKTHGHKPEKIRSLYFAKAKQIANENKDFENYLSSVCRKFGANYFPRDFLQTELNLLQRYDYLLDHYSKPRTLYSSIKVLPVAGSNTKPPKTININPAGSGAFVPYSIASAAAPAQVAQKEVAPVPAAAPVVQEAAKKTLRKRLFSESKSSSDSEENKFTPLDQPTLDLIAANEGTRKAYGSPQKLTQKGPYVINAKAIKYLESLQQWFLLDAGAKADKSRVSTAAQSATPPPATPIPADKTPQSKRLKLSSPPRL